jgi:uncharacterized protein YhbP (UPF0306 family)
MIKNLNKLAKEIIENNQYVTIATTNEKGKPWISPVAYTLDNDYNLYFISMPTSKHGKNIEVNNNIAAAIFDSQQLWGDGIGLQIEAKVEIVKLKDIPRAIKLYAFRKYPYGGLNTEKAMHFAKSMVLDGKKYKIYKITPKTVYMNDPNADTDVRVKIKL